ncbi:flagellar biosynthesis protein FlgA [Clostridium sp. AM58-1XD]|uniref:NAD(P)H-dependent oxidoreductase n=1 Tax=Clostridium sp. AM58-1XD TaxID=2292307 RepID=UPI000E4D7130|nr:flagellar biosynthesis protein FlgA [Clostridium sp. AM58-1XD]RGY97828.1 flagellar biosynthesis protein FlgA [Clostridium sp. AM58-1XD]
MIYHNLYDRCKGKTVTAGIIGTGHFGTAVIIQALNNRMLNVPILADKNLEAARLAFQRAHIPDEKIVECTTALQAATALKEGRYVITSNVMMMMELPVDVIVESTGNAEAGAVHGLAAIQSGKHLVMVNKETDSCVGPILNALAKEKGVVYTPIDGDQHGLLMQMVEWARDTGLEVICAGKTRDAEFIYNRKDRTLRVESDGGITISETVTVQLKDEDIPYIEELPDRKQLEYLKRRKEIAEKLDGCGGFDLCEMVIAANAVGLKPDVPEMNDEILRIPEIPKVLCEKKNGGILKESGIVDVVTCLREEHEAGMGGGVFMVVRCENEYSQMIISTKGCLSNSDGSVSLIYRPYHLCGVEAPTTLLCAGLLEVATGSRRYFQDYDLVQTADTDLSAGEILGNDHDRKLKAKIIPASLVGAENPVPAHMLSGKRLIRDVKKGEMITYEMIEEPEQSVLWALRKKQDLMER